MPDDSTASDDLKFSTDDVALNFDPTSQHHLADC